MKNTTQLLLGAVLGLALLALAATKLEVGNTTIRYFSGSKLTFDAQSKLQDEDGAWTITWAKLSNLAGTNVNNWAALSTNLLTTTNVFQTFTNSLGTAATNVSTAFQPANANLTNLAGVTTNYWTPSTNGTRVGGTESGVTNSDLIASLPMFSDANKRPATKTIVNAKLALGIQAGTATTSGDNTVTNTFGTAFSGAPVVTVSGPTNAVITPVPHIISITPSNVIFGAGVSSLTLQWIAVGAP